MARYQVQSPDGQTHVIEGPDGATPDQVTAAAQQMLGDASGREQRAAAQLAADRKLYDPTNGMSTFERFAAGAGKAVADAGRGIGQLVGVTSQDSIDEAKRLDSPLMNTGAGVAGNIGGNVAMTLLPAGAVAKGAQAAGLARTANAARAFINPATYRGAIGAGATMGALQPVATGEDRGWNATAGALGGLGGQALVNGLGRIAAPVKNALDPLRQKAVDALTSAGVPLDLAQLTGSPAWGRIRSALGDNLFTVGGQEAKRAEQQAAFNNAGLKTIGSGGRAATSDVMGAADDRIGTVFKDVLDRNNVAADPSWVTRLANTHASALENEKQPVANIVNRIFDSIGPSGEIPGQVAYGIKKDLDRMAMSQDSTLAHYAREARGALMDGINGSLSGADQAAFSQARGQFANMKKLEGAIDNEGTGNISPARLANALGQKSNRAASKYGRGPQALVDLAQAGKQVLPDKTGNSGTAARLLAATAPGALLGVGTGVASGLQSGDWTQAGERGATVLGGAMVAPKLLQFLLNNPTAIRYMANGVKNPAVRGLLELPQNNLLAGQAVRQAPNALMQGLLLPAAQ